MFLRTLDDDIYNMCAAEIDNLAQRLIMTAHIAGMKGINAREIGKIRDQQLKLLQLRFNRVSYDTIPIEDALSKYNETELREINRTLRQGWKPEIMGGTES